MSEILSLVPHRNNMLLIDSVLSDDPENFIVKKFIDETFCFLEKEGVPSYCAVEMMAQGVCAYNTTHYTENKKIKIGFMVSIRNFKSNMDFIPMNSELEIVVKPVLIVKNSGTFECFVMLGGKRVSSARITAYVPSEKELKLLKETK